MAAVFSKASTLSGRRHAAGPSVSPPALPATKVVKRSMSVENGIFLVSPRYKSPTKLGQGSYGVVISVVDTKNPTKGRVAIKQISHPFDSLTEAKHVLREVRMLRLLKHPNILPLIDIDDPVSYREFPHLYLVTPASAGDLTDYLNERRWTAPLDDIRLIMCQIFRALKYLHSGNVVHRDLKPGNVLVGSNLTVQLCDLGLARHIDPDEEVGLTKNVTTRHYRAPEVFLAGHEYTHAIDLWAAGCIFYELLMRKKIFEGKKFRHQLEAIITIVGTPTPEDSSFVHTDWSKWFLKRIPNHKAVPLKESMPPGTDDQALDLLSKILLFNPDKRISASKALEHPFLLPLHDEALEPTLDGHIPAETYEPPMLRGDGKKMTKEDMKTLIWEEMILFHPEAASRFNKK